MFAAADAPLTYGGLISLVLLFLGLAGAVAGMTQRLSDIRERLARMEEHIADHDRHHLREEEDDRSGQQ